DFRPDAGASGPDLMRQGRRLCGLALLAALLPGCALIPPDPVVTGPLTAQPPVIMPPVVANGSIYQPTAYGNYPLFEDRRPRNVGDIVTVVIQERTNAAKNVATSSNRNGASSLGLAQVPAFFPPGAGPQQAFDMNGSNKAEGTGSSRA